MSLSSIPSCSEKPILRAWPPLRLRTQACRHRVGEIGAMNATLTLESLDDAAPVGLGPILAQLRFSLDPVDLDFESDDATELSLDVLLRSVGDVPRLVAPVLLLDGE